jgi:hypothetical protein
VQSLYRWISLVVGRGDDADGFAVNLTIFEGCGTLGRSVTPSSVTGLLVRQTAGSSRLPVRIQGGTVTAVTVTVTVTVTGLRPIPVDIAIWSVAVWDEEFRITKGNRR